MYHRLHKKTARWYVINAGQLTGFGLGTVVNADDQWVRCLPVGMREFVEQVGRYTITDPNQCRDFAVAYSVWLNGG